MPHRSRRLPRALIVVPAALCALGLVGASASSAATATAKPSITTLNDANGDGVYSAEETLPKKVQFPYTVNYQVTLFGGTASPPSSHTVTSFSDDKAGSVCQSFLGPLALNSTQTCYFSITLQGTETFPYVNNDTLGYDHLADQALSSSTVDWNGKCNSGNGNGSDPVTWDPNAHCYGGDPGNSYNAGNKGGDEIPGSGGTPNPGGNNVGP